MNKKEIKKFIDIAYNQMKIKFTELEELEKGLNNTSSTYQKRIILFDLSFIFRFLYGKCLKNDIFDIVFTKKSVFYHTLEVMNIFAHYKRFFHSRIKANTLIYVYKSKESDSECEKMITENIIKLSDYFNEFYFIGDPSDIDNGTKYLKLINNSQILKNNNINTIDNVVVYNFTSTELFTAYLYELCEVGLDNPILTFYYNKGEIFYSKIEDYIYNGNLKELFQFYDKKRLVAIANKKELVKPKICIPLLDNYYSRIIRNKDGTYHGKSREKIDDLISRYENGNNRFENEKVLKFYKDLIVDEIDKEICKITMEKWTKKLFDKKIYDLYLLNLPNNTINIRWLLEN